MTAMTSQDLSRRFPRERFTRTLQKLLARLDRQGTLRLDVEDKPYLAPPTKGLAEVRVTGVWAVGSYARGALTCGDLELLVDVKMRWIGLPTYGGRPQLVGLPDVSQVRKQIFGSYPYVTIIERRRALEWISIRQPGAAPEPTFTMDSAVHLYGEGIDWRVALESIPVDANAGHHPRMHDALPLRIEQTYMRVSTAEELVAAQEAGILEWSFAPFSERVALDSELLTPGEATALSDVAKFTGRNFLFTGRKSLEVAPAALIATRDVRAAVLGCFGDKSPFSHGAVKFRFGQSAVRVDEFLSLALHTVVLVPHWSARGPNGAWIITAGPKHPHCLALSRVRAFTVGAGFSTPSFARKRIYARQFYTSREAAVERAEEQQSADCKVVEHVGRQLRDHLAGCQVIGIDTELFGTGLMLENNELPPSERIKTVTFEDVLRKLGGGPANIA